MKLNTKCIIIFKSSGSMVASQNGRYSEIHQANSNIESWNATFKRDFTKCLKFSILKACKLLYKVIDYYRNENNNCFENRPAFDAVLKEKALLIKNSCFKNLNAFKIQYKQRESK